MKYINKKEIACSVNIETGLDIRFLNSNRNFKGWSSHWHNQMEIIYVREGSVLLSTEINDIPKSVKADEIIILPPKQLHSLQSGATGVNVVSLFFDLEALTNQTIISNLFIKSLLNENISPPLTSTNPQLIHAINELIESKNKHNPIYMQGIVYKIIGLLLEETPKRKSTSKAFKIQKIFDYINANINNDVSMERICKEFGYTKSHFCRLFKNSTNMTYSIYIQTLKIEQAQKLLRETNIDIKEVSEKCGFSDFSYFCKCFKKHVKKTPSSFRNAMKTQFERL